MKHKKEKRRLSSLAKAVPSAPKNLFFQKVSHSRFLGVVTVLRRNHGVHLQAAPAASLFPLLKPHC